MRCCPFGQPTLNPAHACLLYDTFILLNLSNKILRFFINIQFLIVFLHFTLTFPFILSHTECLNDQ